jgi:hypothetical protein
LGALLASLAAGCGGGVEGGSTQAHTAEAAGPVEGKLTISQWPLYIDPGKNNSIAKFERATGVDVNYIEDINENDGFFAKMEPELSRGESDGRSLITVSDWLAARMYKLGYLAKLDYSKLPNVKKNLIPALRHPESDVHGSLAGGHDGADRPYRSGSRRELDLRPLQPEVQGPGDDAHRNARLGPDDPQVHGNRPRKGHRKAVARGGRQDQGRRRIGSDPQLYR